MKRTNNIGALRQAVAIRAVQKAAAEADAASAAGFLHAREESWRVCEGERDDTAAVWCASVQALHILPELTFAWSRKLRDREHETHRAHAAVERAQEGYQESAIRLNRAGRLHEMVDDRLRVALRVHARKQNERALSDALERHVQRRSAR